MSYAVSEPTSAIYSSLGGDPELAELVELFVAEMPGRIELLLAHYDRADWEKLGRTAHQLKGAAGSYGFDAISPMAGELESQVRSGAEAKCIQRSLDELTAISRCLRAGVPE